MSGPRAEYIDISAYQPRLFNWREYRDWSARNDGVSRVAIRSSYGYGYVDQHYQQYRTDALAAGIDEIIFYHYCYPEYNRPEVEADWQRRVIGSIRPADKIMLDDEENNLASNPQWAYDWLSRQKAAYQRPAADIWIYASADYIAHHLQDPRLRPYTLVEAIWQYSADETPPIPAPWRSYGALQYTDRATGIPGLPGVAVDANVVIEGDMPLLQLSDPMGKHFVEVAPGRWHCQNTGVYLANAHLDFYRQAGGVFRLPLTEEIYLAALKGTAIVVYEGAVAIYDPNNVTGQRPAGAGPVFLMKLNDGGVGQQIIAKPLLADLNAQITQLKADIAAAPDAAHVSGLEKQVASYEAAVNQIDAIVDTLKGVQV